MSSLPAPFALIYVPGKVFVEGDPAATAERLRTFADLVRAGIAASLASGVLFIFVPLILYRLFKPTSEWPALAMLVLILLSFPISLFSVVNQVAALNLAGGGGAAGSAGTLAALDGPQRDALAYLALQLHHKELMVAEIFWGLWLFPFGICVMRSGFIPRFLGILLMIAGFGYVVDAFAELALPAVRRPDRQADHVHQLLRGAHHLLASDLGREAAAGRPPSRLMSNFYRIGGSLRATVPTATNASAS